MKNRWLVNVFKLAKQKRNQESFSSFVLKENKNDLKSLLKPSVQERLNKSCKIWIKNCQIRFIFHMFLLFFLISLIIVGLCLIIAGAVHHQNLKLFFVIGIAIWIFALIIFLIFYYGESWDNPFMASWAYYLNAIQPYLINQSDLPTSVFLFYFPEQIKADKYPNSYKYFLWLKEDIFPKKITELVLDQMNANKAGYNYVINKDETLNINAYLKYWGDMLVIYEWANFLLKYTQYLEGED